MEKIYFLLQKFQKYFFKSSLLCLTLSILIIFQVERGAFNPVVNFLTYSFWFFAVLLLCLHLIVTVDRFIKKITTHKDADFFTVTDIFSAFLDLAVLSYFSFFLFQILFMESK